MPRHPIPKVSITAVLLLAACSSPASTEDESPPDATVTATAGQQFVPPIADVPLGGTVRFTFESLGHNVTFDNTAGAPTDISGVNQNTSIDRSFSASGTFDYHCTIHPSMTGVVRVAGATPLPPPPPPAIPPPPPGY